jgi:formylglycine-generating enzyme required for sulfatase activity
LLVPGGNFYRTDLVSTYPPNSFPATVADFYLDKYEITVGRFRQFVDAGKGTQASPPVSGAGANLRIEGSGWDSAWNASLAKDMDALNAALKGSPTYCTWTDTAGSNESRPLNCLDWYTAFAFCEWDGARLATEAEWGYAAAGGDEQRKYPWGSAAPDPSKASYYPDSTQKCMGDGVAGCSMADFIVVGSKPAGNGRWGHADLAGNVEEWTLDGHAAYPNPTYPYQCNNCANISVVSERMLRGGSFRSDASGLVSDARGGSNPVRHDIDFGARCARNAGAVNKAAGADCTASAECETGLACLDGVCCKQSSCPVCRNCGGDGTCSITVSSTDDTSGLSCMGNDTCDAAGACKKKNGQGCAAPGECASGNCNSSGVCAALRCPGLAATCGPSGNGDCCASLAVSGGTFYEGYDGVTYTDMSRPATVADFYLDTYEITVGRFRQFVEAGVGTQLSPPASGAGAHPLINGSGWDSNWNTRLPADTAALKARMKCLSDLQTWTDIAGGNESRPQNCLDWYTAFAFCVWDGGRLPTESEWNYVASGGSEQREYPWGSGVDYSKASYNAMGDGDPVLELTDLLVVGSKPAGNGKWGHADLAGNVDEWTLTGDQNGRVIRGGDFIGSDSDSLRSVGRSVHVPSFSYEGFGVRCARTSL